MTTLNIVTIKKHHVRILENSFGAIKQENYYFVDYPIDSRKAYYFHEQHINQILNKIFEASDKLLYDDYNFVIEIPEKTFLKTYISELLSFEENNGIILDHKTYSIKSEVNVLKYVLDIMFDNYKVSCNGDVMLSKGKLYEQ